MPVTFNIAVTLDDATLAAIRGSSGPVVVPVVPTPVPVTPTPVTPIPGPVNPGNGIPANSDPRLRRVNSAPCMWAIFAGQMLSSIENVALNDLLGVGETARRIQHYFIQQVNGRYRVTPTGYEYDYASPDGSRWIAWNGPGDPPGVSPYV